MLTPGDVHRRQDGITLVELLVVVLILGIVGAFTVTALVQGIAAAATAQERLDVIEEGHRSLARISREMRSACRVDALETDFANVTVSDRGAAAETLRFEVELAGDQVVIRRWLVAGGTETAQGEQVVASDLVPAPPTLFTARGANGAPLTPDATTGAYVTSLVREVDITLGLQSADGDDVTVETSVNLRNQGSTSPC